MANVIAGNVVQFTLTFTDETVDPPLLLNPSGTVYWTYRIIPTGQQSAITHTVTWNPSPPPNYWSAFLAMISFDNPEPGTFVILMDTTGQDGTWSVEGASGPGGGEAVSPATDFVVVKPELTIAY